MPRRGSAGSVLRSQGTLGRDGAFALSRDGDQGVDVPMLAPARSRCRWVDGEPVPQWRVIVANEETYSIVDQVCCGDGAGGEGAVVALGKVRRSECPNGVPHV